MDKLLNRHTQLPISLDTRSPLILYNFSFYRFVISMVYFGLSFSTSSLGGNEYVNFFISAAVEIPAYIFCNLALNRIGRRWPMGISMIMSGICLLLILPIPKCEFLNIYHTYLSGLQSVRSVRSRACLKIFRK